MNNLNRKLNELRQQNPKFAKLLDELLSYKDGQGDYAADRYNLPDPDIDAILKEIQKDRKVKENKTNVSD